MPRYLRPVRLSLFRVEMHALVFGLRLVSDGTSIRGEKWERSAIRCEYFCLQLLLRSQVLDTIQSSGKKWKVMHYIEALTDHQMWYNSQLFTKPSRPRCSFRDHFFFQQKLIFPIWHFGEIMKQQTRITVSRVDHLVDSKMFYPRS